VRGNDGEHGHKETGSNSQTQRGRQAREKRGRQNKDGERKNTAAKREANKGRVATTEKKTREQIPNNEGGDHRQRARAGPTKKRGRKDGEKAAGGTKTQRGGNTHRDTSDVRGRGAHHTTTTCHDVVGLNAYRQAGSATSSALDNNRSGNGETQGTPEGREGPGTRTEAAGKGRAR
jgi:hypothetical protein